MHETLFSNPALAVPPPTDTPSSNPLRLVRSARQSEARLVRWMIILSVVLIGVIVAATAYIVLYLRDRSIDESGRRLEGLTLVLAEQIDRSFKSMELVENATIDRIKRMGIISVEDFKARISDRETYEHLRDQIKGLQQVDALVLLAPDGWRVNLSRKWPAPPFKSPDQDFLHAFRSHPDISTYVGRPIHNPITGAWVLNIARKIVGSHGKYLGVVLGVATVGSYERLFRTVAPSPHSSIALVRRDGVLLARWPAGAPNNTAPQPYRRLFSGELSASGRALVRRDGEFDRGELLTSIRALAGYPVVVMASVPMSDVLAGWRVGVVGIGGGGILLALAVGGLVYFSARRVERRLRGQNVRFETALGNMTQGLVMYDASAKVVVCNRRFVEMYGLSSEDVKPGTSLVDMLAARGRCGWLEGDPKRRCKAILARIAEGKTTVWPPETIRGRTIQIVDQPMQEGGWVSTHEDVTERRQAAEKIAFLATHDALTGLPNRTLFHEWLGAALSATGKGERVAVFYLDLDRFKKINDTLGHPIGDELLKAVAERLSRCVRSVDTVARIGGDEFAIIQPALGEPRNAAVLAKRIIRSVEAQYEIAGHEIVISTSIGIAVAPEDGVDADCLIKNADMALYSAKTAERGTYRFFKAEMDARINARADIEADLRKALSNGEFELFYQPLIDARSGEVSCCEALLRWRHPKNGLISPADFIPVAEDMGVIVQIGEWVLRQACADAATWPNDIAVAVNVSPVQFRRGRIAQTVLNALTSAGLPTHRLEIEITESILLEESELVSAALAKLHDLGIRIVMDDFGTGYSSLGYLQRYPFDKIKIDASFVRGISESGELGTIVEAITKMASAMKIGTVIEGIETRQQLEKVKAWGCTELQGYLFSHPKPIAEIMPMFSRRIVARKRSAA